MKIINWANIIHSNSKRSQIVCIYFIKIKKKIYIAVSNKNTYLFRWHRYVQCMYIVPLYLYVARFVFLVGIPGVQVVGLGWEPGCLYTEPVNGERECVWTASSRPVKSLPLRDPGGKNPTVVNGGEGAMNYMGCTRAGRRGNHVRV